MLPNSQMEELNYLSTESQPVLDFLTKDLLLQPLTLEEHLNSLWSFMLLTHMINRSKHESSQGFPLLKYLAQLLEMLIIKQLSLDPSIIAKTKTQKKKKHLQPFLLQHLLPLPKILLQKSVFWKRISN